MQIKASNLLIGNINLVIKTGDLLSAPCDVIVNPANGGLSHGGGLAAQILLEAGDSLEQECNTIIDEHGLLNTSEAVSTTAGRLPYKAVVHVVGPKMGEGHESEKISKAVTSCLELCCNNDWESIAFPAISTGIFSVPLELCAKGFLDALNTYSKAQDNVNPNAVYIFLGEKEYDVFLEIFNTNKNTLKQPSTYPEKENIGIIEIDGSSLPDKDDEVNDWFN